MSKDAKKKIKYLAHYHVAEKGENRYMALSAGTKIDYISRAIAKAWGDVEILSASNSQDKAYPPSKTQIGDGISLTLFRGFRRGSALANKLSTVLFYSNLFLQLLVTLKKEDTVIVYHSLTLIDIVKWLKRLKKCKLILEVEEIYGDVTGDARAKAKEMALFSCADGYIFPTALLNEAINTDQKPYVLSHGTYAVEAERMPKAAFRKAQGWDNDKTHVVYAGTLDPRKGGAAAAAAAVAYLPDSYYIHILGFGTEAETAEMNRLVQDLAARHGNRVSFDGCLTGEAYIQFLQGCDIGLSTQNPEAAFNATSFPSKILSYMANGLRVVSVRIPAIAQSAVGASVDYYDTQTPEEIAKAIQAVKPGDAYNPKVLISTLDKDFQVAMAELIDRLNL